MIDPGGIGFSSSSGYPIAFQQLDPNYWSRGGFSDLTPANFGALPTSAGAGTGSPAGGFNLNPQPTAGVGPYGAVPGQLGLPDPAADLGRQIPNLAQLNAGASGAIESALIGELPDDVLRQIQDASARFGVSGGMPGAGLYGNRSLRDIGLTSLDQQRWGASAYPQFVGAVSGTQTVSPALQNEIASQNALNAAAPNPSDAAARTKSLFDQYSQSIGGSGGGGYGGSGTISAPQRTSSPSYSGGAQSYSGSAPSVPSGGGWGYAYDSADPSGGFRSGNVPNSAIYPTEFGMDTTGGQGPFPNDQVTVEDPFWDDLYNAGYDWDFGG